jgi:hypothetical protein
VEELRVNENSKKIPQINTDVKKDKRRYKESGK